MASTGKTENLNLNQWAADDPVLREDFNADNRILDAHNHDSRYYTHAEADALLAQRPVFVTGQYSGPTIPTSTSKCTIQIGFTPQLAIVLNGSGTPIIMLNPKTSAKDSSEYTVEWGDDSVTWYGSGSVTGSIPDTTYTYIILG